jgi:hypothetical protein
MPGNQNNEITHRFATIASRNRFGGQVTTATSGLTVVGLGVGCERDKDDTVTDSPERDGVLSSETFVVVRRSEVRRAGEAA